MANNKHVSVGMVGGGQVAKAHVVGFVNAPLFFKMERSYSLDCIAEANDELARSTAKRYNFSRWTSDWKKVTGDPSLDLIDVLTPTYLHKEPAIDALEHGKHLIVEKPLATNVRDAKEIYDVAKRHQGINLVGFNYRRAPAVALAKQMIREGKIGKVNHIRTQFLEDWAGPPFRVTWRFNREKAGGGVLADLGSHAIDLVRFLAGEPKAVFAKEQTFVQDRVTAEDERVASDVDDAVFAIMTLDNGAIAEVGASWVAAGKKVGLEFEVFGSEGSIGFSMERPNELMYYSSTDPKELRGYKTIYLGPAHPYGEALIFNTPTMGTGYVDSIINQMKDFMFCIEQQKKIEPSLYDGLRVNELIAAIHESSTRQKWVTVD